MLKKLDLYIIKKFLGTYVFSIILIIGIAVIFDLTEKLDNFADHKPTFKQIVFDYYLNFIPYFTNLFSALFTFIAVIFFTSKLAYNTEIVAILASGVSYNRILRPYIISATIIGASSFALSSYIIPPANKVRLDFELQYIKGRKPTTDKNVHVELKPGQFVYINQFKSAGQVGENFSLETFENGELKSKLTAKRISYDTINTWTAENYLLIDIDSTSEEIKTGDSLTLHLEMKPEEFLNSRHPYETMSNKELDTYINKQKNRGVGNIAPFVIEKHKRYASAFTAFILTIIGVSIASRKTRGGMGLHIMFGIAISFSYILFSQIAVSFSTAGSMDPALSVWIPNLVYSVFAFILYRNAQK